MLDLRQATMGDSDRLFTWRNDPVTRQWSASTAEIRREDHDRWMQLNVLQGYPAHLVLIADTDIGPVGTVRFDGVKKDVMSYSVSINVAPEHRGKKYGYAMLDLACKMMPDSTLLADIKTRNLASHSIFRKCGFEEQARSGEFVRYRRDALA